MLKITIGYDQDCESPSEYDGWTPHSFSPRHINFKHPDDLPDLTEKLEKGLAFVLSYYEHGRCLWFRGGTSTPPGVEFQWDGTRTAGVLIWDEDEVNLGGRTYEERAKDADAFLETYTAWANGDCYYYVIEDLDEVIDSCGGFIGDTDYMLTQIAEQIEGQNFTVVGDLAPWLESELREKVEAQL